MHPAAWLWRSIKAVDNHAHVLAPDIADDKGYDALRCDALPSSTSFVPANLRFGASTQETWKTLYGVEPKTAHEAEQKHTAMLQKLQDEHGDNYYNWILDQASIETVLANRVTMTPSLQPPRFLWVPYVDALLFPSMLPLSKPILTASCCSRWKGMSARCICGSRA